MGLGPGAFQLGVLVSEPLLAFPRELGLMAGKWVLTYTYEWGLLRL